jgi:hypothetical protein
MKNLTTMSVYTQEVFGAIGMMFNATPFLVNPVAYFDDMRAANERLAGAFGKADRAAKALTFAPDDVGNRQRLGMQSATRGRFDQFGQQMFNDAARSSQINININTQATDGKQLLHEMNRALRDQGSDVIIR